MKQHIESIIKQQGYGPIFQSIDRSIHDLKSAGYDRAEIKETLRDCYGIGDSKVNSYLISKGY